MIQIMYDETVDVSDYKYTAVGTDTNSRSLCYQDSECQQVNTIRGFRSVYI